MLNQFVANADVSRLSMSGRSRADERRLRRRVSAARTIRSAPASRTRTATAACRISSAGRRRSARKCFPDSVRRTKSSLRDSVAGYVDVEATSCVAAVRRRGPRRALQRLRRHGGRQDHGARRRSDRAGSCVDRSARGFRAPSLGQSFFSSTATNFLNLGQGLVPVDR